jgi:myo-inositol-1-phosphate synthase
LVLAQDNVQIAPASGKLGVLIPGLGAVSTTFIAGVEAVKRGLALPVGSLTQLSTIRLGKRTDNRSPMIKILFLGEIGRPGVAVGHF